MAAGLLAGVASVRFDAPLGAEMMGYGARTASAASSHDPLTVRGVYLCGGSELMWLECDVCLFAPAQTDALRARIAARIGLPVERILLGSIHTHSGPDTGFGALLAGGSAPDYVEAIFEAAVLCAARARDSAAPAKLGLSRAEARIGRNRRLADGPLDAGVLVARVDAADGTPRAVLFVHGWTRAPGVCSTWRSRARAWVSDSTRWRRWGVSWGTRSWTRPPAPRRSPTW
jgi:hypothetical protein